ncbi:MAG: xanthine dehydrogenase family protein molybdopterin-binding subunit [Roseobacter sp.]|jgi:carbon-monoxide dehydrogenase large subunit|uniref:Carbon monoxide dehydrogenase large chain n=3 Tax=Sulfitobacter TaxID=60136 RepID=A0AAX3AEK9_9RHOB|nr:MULTISPECIES: xanthine dehydrogenase family protein molybdopterin-binding subunit [Sulfitobacter]MBG64088.1 xanthine dehydrogenase family protein molybdopterin-binding subunit [Roseobacter sp.]HBM40677.1 xanthine dehydrogenase family protein molybdopterin-binding subunit [Sulfitobacter sp.]OAN74488.1 carbon monoxide dehydrogenase [Sulfitobacter pontiacus]ULO22088.1 xanthine dehydrogenase family protein molybdopterin-binding subunit [Sulfitobacter sp. CB2047]UOA24588.1 Carbon monoxide dehydr|tara:strand:- start:1642 stop:4014 length:2373 start_codon:yes stop_codon:yes gene_type:complete
MPKDTGIGASTRRREDVRFLKGKGQYTDDIPPAHDQAAAVFARSTVANGVIKSIDTSVAESMPGVLAVFTGADFADVGGNPAGWLINSRDGEPMKEPKRPVLAHGKVRHVGDAYAAVIAETEKQARDAVEAIEADIEELPAIMDVKAALTSDNFVHDEIGTNQCFDWGWIEDNRRATDDAIKGAAHVTTLELVNNRLVPNAMEPRCSMASYKESSDEYTLHTTSQNPHLTRLLISAFVMGIPENKLTVIAPDVGGGFGSKIYHYGEEALVLAAAKRVGRTVKWTSDRTEAFLTDAHGRDHVTTIELATDAEGNFLAFRTETYANVGAYLSNFATATPTFLHGTLMAGNYTVPNVYVNVKAVFTNTAPVDAYRGAGRPEATYSLERVIDKCARELGMDPIALRRKNFIKPDQYPFASAAGLEYDSGNYDALMDKMEEVADVAGFAERRKASEAKGLLRGFGVNAYVEACGIAPSNLVGVLGSRVGLYDAATVRVNATGNLSVMVGAHSHGQGHETVFPQIVADMLGIDAQSIDIVHGDTSKIPFGMGTYGSRSLAVCGSAVVRATEKIIAKAKKIAGHMLEAAETDIELKDGQFSVVGTNKGVSFGEVALKAYIPHNFPIEDIEPGLEETAFYDPANFTFPSGAYCCEVEVDPDTGKVRVDRMTAVDDFGNVMNPMIVTGQVHGGLGQGIGQALLEAARYNEDGQLESASYMDYAMPRADDLPFYIVDHSQGTPCTHNPLGAKGCGEAGAIGSPPTVVNAVIDALQSGGKNVTHIDMPLTPHRVWSAMNNA